MSVNTPPAKAVGLWLRLKAGLIGLRPIAPSPTGRRDFNFDRLKAGDLHIPDKRL
jgi:hypothetical protein